LKFVTYGRQKEIQERLDETGRVGTDDVNLKKRIIAQKEIIKTQRIG